MGEILIPRAHIDIALASRGATASSEAADVVLTADRLDVLADAMQIARRLKRVAWRAVVVGLGLSLVAMGFAVAGIIPPAAGAMGQEAIDLLAIGIALLALLPGRQHPHLLAPDVATLRRLQQGHHRTRPRHRTAQSGGRCSLDHTTGPRSEP